MSYRSIDAEKVEVIFVFDERYEQPHFLLLLSTHSTTAENVEETQHVRYLAGKIDIHALYLFGPLRHKIGKTVCRMGGEISPDDTVRISNGDILIHLVEMRGLNIGSFMLNRIVRWSKGFETERKVRSFKLVKQDAIDVKNKVRRNKLYRKFGMRLVFKDPATEEEGSSAHDLMIAELLDFSDREWSNISVCHWLDGFRALYGDQQKIRESLRENTRRLAYYRRRSDRFDVKVKTIRKALNHIVNWPLLITTAIVAYGLGASEWFADLVSAKHYLGF